MQTFQHFLLQFENSGKNASMPVQVNSHVLVRALVFENLYKTVFSVGTEFFSCAVTSGSVGGRGAPYLCSVIGRQGARPADYGSFQV